MSDHHEPRAAGPDRPAADESGRPTDADPGRPTDAGPRPSTDADHRSGTRHEPGASGVDDGEPGRRIAAPGRRRTGSDVPPPWLRTSAVVIGAILVIGLLLLIAAATLPSWWAGVVGRQVDGVPAAGILWGLTYGAIFTIVPLALAFLAVRATWHWKVRLGIGVAALVVLMPNLLTLAVAIGATERTRAARTVMTVQAPNLRLATLIAVLVTVVLSATIALVVYRMTASRRELKELRERAGQE